MKYVKYKGRLYRAVDSAGISMNKVKDVSKKFTSLVAKAEQMSKTDLQKAKNFFEDESESLFHEMRLALDAVYREFHLEIRKNELEVRKYEENRKDRRAR